jgi:hypothetical protein
MYARRRIFPPEPRRTAAGPCRLWPKFLPYVLSYGVLGLRWLANLEVRTRTEYFSREYVNWWLLYHFLPALGGVADRLVAAGDCALFRAHTDRAMGAGAEADVQGVEQAGGGRLIEPEARLCRPSQWLARATDEIVQGGEQG